MIGEGLTLVPVISNSLGMPAKDPRKVFAERLKALRAAKDVSTLLVAENVLGHKDRASEVTKTAR